MSTMSFSATSEAGWKPAVRQAGTPALPRRSASLRLAVSHASSLACGRAIALFTALVFVLLSLPAHAYIEAPFSLGKVIQDSTNVLVMRVENVDREKNLIVYSK